MGDEEFEGVGGVVLLHLLFLLPIGGGIVPGAEVVTAGVHVLSEGQKVKRYDIVGGR